MASLDVIALDPAVPQLRAPGVGDTYHFCRVVEFQDGTVSAPALTNVGDPNTGIYFPTDDVVGLTAGGVETFRVGASSVIVNNGAADVDFQVKGDNDNNTLYVDGSADSVGIGTSSPGSKLDVKGTLRLSGSSSGYVGLAPAAAAGSTTYTLPSADGTNGQVLVTNGSGTLSWADSDANGVDGPASSTDNALVRWDGTTGKLVKNSNAILTDPGYLTIEQGMVINESGADSDTRIEGDTNANLVFVDASTDRVGFGTNAPDRLVDVNGTSKFRDQILISGGQALGLGLQALQMPTGVESTIGAGLSTRTGVSGESIIQFGNNMNTYYTGSVNAAKAGAMIRLDTRGVEPTPGASAYSVFQIQTRAAGVADPSYTVPVQIGAAPQGTFCIQTNGLITANYGFVVNEGGGDYDTRFEGDTDTHLFFADASTDQVGIGTSAPGAKLDVAKNDRTNGPMLRLTNSAQSQSWAVGDIIGSLDYYTSDTNDPDSRARISGVTEAVPGGLATNPTQVGLAFYTYDRDNTTRLSEVARFTYNGVLFVGSSVVKAPALAGGDDIEIYGSNIANPGVGTGGAGSGPSGNIAIFTGNSFGINLGGTLSFGGNIDGTTTNRMQFAVIAGRKSNATSGNAEGYMQFYTTDSSNLSQERMRLDSSGNLGLGVTPKAWLNTKAFDIGSFGAVSCDTATSGVLSLSYNAYAEGASTWKYKGAGSAGLYQQTEVHKWFTAASGTAGNAITFTQAMTLDASGNLGVGTTSPSYRLQAVRSGDGITAGIAGGTYGIRFDNGGTYSSGASTIHGVDSTLTGTYQQLNINGSVLTFQTSATERARITSGGELIIGTTAAAASERLRVRGAGNTSATYNCIFENSDGTLVFNFENAGKFRTGTLADSPYNYIVGGTNRDLYVDSTGYIGYVSSTRESKSNIVSIKNVSWLLNLNPVSFNRRKRNEDREFTNEIYDETEYGLIAEEVESVNPELCFYDDADSGGKLRGVTYSKLITPMLKLLQEQQAMINELKAEVAALKGA